MPAYELRAPLAAALAQSQRLIAGEYGDQVDVVLGPEPVFLPIDIDAFAILARNLIENAVVQGKPPRSLPI